MDVEFANVLEPRWVVEEPSYRVVFWTKLNDPEPPLVPLWSETSHTLRGVSDVTQALTWAEENAEGRQVCVYAEVDRGPDLGFVLLRGTDPTRAG